MYIYLYFLTRGPGPSLDPAFLALQSRGARLRWGRLPARSLPGPDALQGTLSARGPRRRTLVQRLRAAAAPEAGQVAHVHEGAASRRTAGGLHGRGRRGASPFTTTRL